MPHVDMKDMLHHPRDNGCMVSAVNPGCYGIMLDASREPAPGSIRRTRTMTDITHTDKAPVAGEPGYLPGAEDREMSGLSSESGAEQVPGREVNPCRVAIALPGRSIVQDR